MKVSGSVEVEISVLISACGGKWSGSLRADKSTLPLLEIELSSLYLLLLTHSVSTLFLQGIVCPGYVLVSLHSKYLVNCIYGNHAHVFPSYNPLNAELNPICHLLALLVHHILHVSRIRVKGFLHKFCAFITDR